jgi:hypothetical protein
MRLDCRRPCREVGTERHHVSDASVPDFLSPAALLRFVTMPAVKQAPTRQAISLKGSTKLVTEFFKYAVNTSVQLLAHRLDWLLKAYGRILFQRSVYPEDDFHMVKKYGQTVLVTQDLALENYLEKYVALIIGSHVTIPNMLLARQDSHTSPECVLLVASRPTAHS